MIRALCYAPGTESPAELPADEAVVDPTHNFVWFDCEQPGSQEELGKLGERLGVNEFVLEDLRTAGQRTKLDHYSDHYHVAVHDCEVTTRGFLTREIDVVFGNGWLISVRQAAEGPDGEKAGPFPMHTVRQRFETQRTQHQNADEGLLLWALLDVVIDRYFGVTDALDDRLDDAEAQVLGDDDADDASLPSQQARPRALFELSKVIVDFRRNAAPLREVVSAILRREAACINETALVHFQDVGDHVLRVAELLESQRDVLTNLRDAELAVVSNRLNRSMQKLTAWGAILIVATLVTGVLGMNFATAPNLGWEAGFAVVAGLVVLLSVPMLLYFRRRHWI